MLQVGKTSTAPLLNLARLYRLNWKAVLTTTQLPTLNKFAMQ